MRICFYLHRENVTLIMLKYNIYNVKFANRLEDSNINISTIFICRTNDSCVAYLYMLEIMRINFDDCVNYKQCYAWKRDSPFTSSY